MDLWFIHSSIRKGLLICDDSTTDPREMLCLPSTSSGEPRGLTHHGHPLGSTVAIGCLEPPRFLFLY